MKADLLETTRTNMEENKSARAIRKIRFLCLGKF